MSRAPDMSSRSGYRLVALAHEQLDAAFICELDELARSSVEPNPCLESWMLLPALELYDSAGFFLGTVRAPDGQLTGAFALRFNGRRPDWPVEIIDSWTHHHFFLGSPLIADGHLEATLRAFFDFVQQSGGRAPVLDFGPLRIDGPIGQAFRRELAARPWPAVRVQEEERALLDLDCASTDQSVSHKHVKNLTRLQRRLAEQGELRYRVLDRDEDALPWIERFLALEASGWKRTVGAMNSVATEREYFIRAFGAAHRLGRLQMLEMWLGGQLIAAKCNLRGHDGIFTCKIARDESWDRFSPGLLLERFYIEHMRAQPDGVRWIDSCARSGHAMAERLFPQRRALARYTLATRGVLPRFLVRHGDRLAQDWPRTNRLLHHIPYRLRLL